MIKTEDVCTCSNMNQSRCCAIILMLEITETLFFHQMNIRQQERELTSVRVNFVCNEEHCIENEYSMLVDMNLPIDSVFDEILNKLREADRSAAESGKCTCHGCTLNGGHLVEHSLVSCQRLIQCDYRWEFVKVLFEYEADDQSPEGDGEEMEPCVSCGDEPYKLSMMDLGRNCVKFAKRIGVFDHQTVGELKIVLAKTIPAVAKSGGVRVVFDCPNTDENNPLLNEFAGHRSCQNFKPLYEAGFNPYGLVTVFVDVGPADCLLADRTVTDFFSTTMRKLILRHKYKQRIEVFFPTKALFGFENDDGEHWKEQPLSEAVEDDPSMDFLSCPSTPQISPVVSESDDDM
uniref:Zpr1 domain-containing protein n=1 Tax=Globodera pallida TaxID=36090 RepID=A0A183BQ09_GLOPA